MIYAGICPRPAYTAQSLADSALRMSRQRGLCELLLLFLLLRLRRLLRGFLRGFLLLGEVLEDHIDGPGLPLASRELHDASAPDTTTGFSAARGILEDTRVALEGREVLVDVETIAVEGTCEKRFEGVLLEEREGLGGD